MAATAEITVSPDAWTAIATAGDVTATADRLPYNYALRWAITESTSAPTLSSGHTMEGGDNLSMTLSGSERLWIRGVGVVFVTASAPV